MRAFVAIVLFVAGAVTVASQQVSSQTRAQAIAQSFNKQKHVIKAKFGVTREKFKDVRNEPVVKPNAADYAGTYEMADLGFVIALQVGSDGRIQASGHEQSEQQSRSFRLENARIDGALLTATKVYQDGATEKFEGAFLSRTVRDAPAAAPVTTFGLGVILATPVEVNGNTYERLFLQLKP
jgi:hypothetical protein